MRTRIKVVEGARSKGFYPQYKWLCFWRYFTAYDNEVVVFSNIKAAQDFVERSRQDAIKPLVYYTDERDEDGDLEDEFGMGL